MTTYRVKFFKNLVNSNGHEFKCEQGSVEIHRARNRERALEAAQRRYERVKKVGNWTIYADVAELEAIEADGSSQRYVEPASRAHFAASPVKRRPSLAHAPG